MGIKELWAKVDTWWTNRDSRRVESHVAVDEDGLICDEGGGVITAQAEQKRSKPGGLEIVKKAGAIERKENIEILSKAFDSLIDQLSGINEHLSKQIVQHEKLMQRIDELPELLENVPNSVENQRQLVDGLIEQLKGKALKEQQFVDIVEKIPAETAKQTHSLIDMNQKLSVSADIDAQINENFNRFNQTLDKLDGDTVSQTDSIIQMSKTFAASDRYLKYIMSRQSNRFTWVFSIAIGVCVFAIIALAVVILMVLNR
jgi:DNA repair exonuclease SbcCD ATPase subunit